MVIAGRVLAERSWLYAKAPGSGSSNTAVMEGRLDLLACQVEAMGDPERAASAGDAEVTEERGSPAAPQSMRRVGGPAAGDLADPEQITRRERLRQLQSELAHLKKTPSMQLLARQQIPRLEEAIKHLIAEMQASA